jgi:hypothetical protein
VTQPLILGPFLVCADRVPYLLRWTQEVCFGVWQLAAALHRVELLLRQLAAVLSPQQESGPRELLPPRPRIYCASKLARGNLEGESGSKLPHSTRPCAPPPFGLLTGPSVDSASALFRGFLV